jgi:hypothetical protein
MSASQKFLAIFRFPVPRYLRTPFLLSLLVTFSLFLGLLALYTRLQPQVPFFYSFAEKNEYLAAKIWLWVFPVFSLSISFFHPLLLRALEHRHERIVPILFAWSTILIQVLLALAFWRIIWLIT